jgi:hypothetical protein
VLVPVDSATTRLVISTRGGSGDGLAELALAPLGLAGFEPAHLIMRRTMLRILKARAEKSRARSSITLRR